MPRLVIRIVGSDRSTGADVELARSESNRYDPDHLDAEIRKLLAQFAVAAAQGGPAVNAGSFELSVNLSAHEQETVRPSLHLSRETIRQLADLKSEFDFDPYV